MSLSPVWFGGNEAPLFGCLHLPEDGVARGGVVLCPTLAVEAMSAHPAYRLLAESLADRGLAALRFDYPGTGDSAGNLAERGIIAGWLEAIATARSYLRSCGVGRVGVVGMRIGALLAATACAGAGDEVDALVLWDPVSTGRRYLREQQALRSLSIGGSPARGGGGEAELLGLVLSPETAAELGALSFERIEDPPARRSLVLTRPDRADEADLIGRHCGSGTTFGQARGQAELVDVLPDLAQLPLTTIDEIAGWLRDAIEERPARVARRSPDCAVVATTPSGTQIIERVVQMGPVGLCGIVTEPAGGAFGPAVICLNAGLLPHIGPARLWVELARHLAAIGMGTLRFDLSGVGDSGRRQDQSPGQSYPLEAMDDVAEAVRAVRPDDPHDVVFVGLCSGAYHSIEAGIAYRPRGVCPINPILSFQPPEMTDGGAKDPRRAAVEPYNPLFQLLRQSARLRRLGDQLIPPALWWLFDRLGLQPSPARGLERLRAAGVDTLLICGEPEAFPLERRAGPAMRRLASVPGFRMEVLAESDHALFGAKARERAFGILAGHLEEHFAPAGTVPLDPKGALALDPR